MSQPNEMFDPPPKPGSGTEPDAAAGEGPVTGSFGEIAPAGSGGPTTRTWVLWGIWRLLLVGIAVAGFVAGEGAWRWVWLVLLAGIVGTSWFSRPGRKAPVPRALSEPGDHRVVLQVAGDKPIPVIRALRRITGADLVTAKNLFESAPVIVAENLSQESAAQAVHLLTSAGARATVTPMDRST